MSQAAMQVLVGREGAVMTLTLNRPEARNALTGAMYDTLTAALRDADADASVRVVLIEGGAEAFSAGNDIGDFVRRAGSDSGSDSGSAGGGGGGPAEVLAFLRTLVGLAKPVVAAVGGVAVGIGTTMLLHCDLIYAAPEAVFSTPFVRLGLVPEAASSLLLARRIGPARANAMLLAAESLTAAQALQAGLVNEVVPWVELGAHARARAAGLAALPPRALAASRRLIRGDQSAVLAQIEVEAAVFADAMASDEARLAFAAFLSRRRGA